MLGWYKYKASAKCKPLIEDKATWGHTWTSTFNKFERYQWINKNKRHIAFKGDAIKFENAFGGKKNYRYECVFDIDDDKVITLNVYEGKW